MPSPLIPMTQDLAELNRTESYDTVSTRTKANVNIAGRISTTSTTAERKRGCTEMEAIEIPPAKIPLVRSSSWETSLSEAFSDGNVSTGTTTDTVPSDDQSSIKSTSVNIPDMFSSIMSVEPLLNPHYEKVKVEADAWAAMVYKLDENKAKRNAKADFAYMNAIWAPDADEEAFRMMVDWHHWVFAFDDQFDEGHLKDDPSLAQAEIDATIAIMTDEQAPISIESNPIRHVFQTTWKRLQKRAGPEQQERWIKNHKDYFTGLIRQVEIQKTQKKLSVDEYIDFRRQSIGAMPSCSLVEYACGIDISQSVLDHPSIVECEKISADLVFLVNDVLSLRKDLEYDVEHNLIILLKKQGLSDQEAVERIGDMLDDCYRRWYRALAEMPIWGEEIDRQVLKYVDGCRNIALGNLYWSYKSGRYLKEEGPEVRATRVLNLPIWSPST
ncbi:Presilphiperfolan-8-beta-ol synthase [Xylariaceae sp. FL1651]|nr:Presilphiperfolan-8-beta-ol synthase [Xylariaceae sp. FL1651]